MKITETDKTDGVQRDVERERSPASPYLDSGTTWGRPQMGKNAGYVPKKVNKTTPEPSGDSAAEVGVTSVVKTVKGLMG